MRRCGYVVTSLPDAVLLAVLTCPEQVTNDERGITTRKLRAPPFATFPLLVPPTVATQMPVPAGLGPVDYIA